jgi:hypothetical protein
MFDRHRHRSLVAAVCGVAAVAGCDPFASFFPGFTEGRPLALARPRTAVTRPEVQTLSTDGQLPTDGVTRGGECRVAWNQATAQEDITVIDDVIAFSSGSTNNGVRSTAAHANGRRYFEVTFSELGGASYNGIAVIADDPQGHIDESYFEELGCFGGIAIGHCASITSFGAGDVVSVLADLDAGRVDFAVNGVLTAADSGFDPRAFAIVPGAGPFRAGVVLGDGARARANFGAEPFAFAPPSGFRAWNEDLEQDADGNCLDAPATPATPAPVSSGVDCDSGYTLTSIRTGAHEDDRELVVFGTHDSATLDVRLDRPGRYVLVIGSYNTGAWQISVGDGVILEKVLAYGYEAQTVTAPDGVVVENRAYTDGQSEEYAVGHGWPYTFGGSDTVGYVGLAERDSGLPLSFYAGAYTTTGFTLHADDVPTTGCR